MTHKEYTVNRKQFHFLLVQFLAENRLTKKWYEDSVNFKKGDVGRQYIYQKYKFGEGDDFSTHLYKCIAFSQSKLQIVVSRTVPSA